MVDKRPVFNQINLVVRDMAAMVEFYERLGVEIAPTIAPWDRHHRNFSTADGLDFDLDSAASRSDRSAIDRCASYRTTR
jgi:catechol 2,3-dioxygenase-like lactoylglutathione lyase family enzyme